MKRPTTTLLLSCLALALLAAPAIAADAPLARLSFNAAAVEIQPAAEVDRYVLKIALPNGTVEERGVSGGEAASFSLFDRNGVPRPDGLYRWEIVLSPRLSAAASAALAAARESGDESALAALRANGSLPEPRIESGSFRIANGTFVAADQVEPRPTLATRGIDDQDVPTRDQVIPDDLIVQGSLCVGFDCVNNESFGFDTIRMKENNTRVKFEDTSTGTFPTTDWQLTANDSASGGANKFSIEDITSVRVPFTITGGASTNSIFVDSTGRVGFRTSTPVLDLHVSTSNTPALRLEQTSAGGFTAQTWDIAGNEANFFVRDVTSGSRLPFRIRPGAPTSSVDISASGQVGVGDASPEDFVDVNVAGANGGLTLRSSADGTLPQLTLIEPTRTWRFRVNNPGDFVFTDATASQSPFRIQGGNTVSDRLVVTTAGISVTGSITQNAVVIHPDYVFEPTYDLPSIDEHAAEMWQNKALPAVGPGKVNEKGEAVIELATHQLAMLEELERAHIYIEQLHKRLAQLETTMTELKTASTEPE